jgi:hypothetical protein
LFGRGYRVRDWPRNQGRGVLAHKSTHRIIV